MFSWIIGSSLKFRGLVLAAAVALLVFGTGQLRKMPVDVFPEFAPPKVEVQTEGPEMTSGLSQVVLLFKMRTDLMRARQRVQERVKLAIAELPQSSGINFPIGYYPHLLGEYKERHAPQVRGQQSEV